MTNIINQYNYDDYKRGVFYPIVETKYSHCKAINNPEYFCDLPPGKIAIDEIFLFADDRIVPNIIFQRYLISNYGRIFDRFKGNFMNPVPNKPVNGYYKVKFSYYKSFNEIEAKDVYVHRAVLLMFNYIPGAENPSECELNVNHIDGDHSNNKLSNLEWLTPYQNNIHAIHTGLKDTLLIDHNYTLNDYRQPIRIICSMLQEGFSNKEISDRTGVDQHTISEIRSGRRYCSISKEYNFPKISRSKANDEIVIKICEMLEHGYMPAAIADTLGVKRQMVAEIKNRRNYTYISCNYKW
jgi:hypothetical protein